MKPLRFLVASVSVLSVAACGRSATAPADPVHIEVEPLLARATGPGDSVRFQAYLVRGDGARESIEASWSSSRPDIVRVRPGGWAIALDHGAAVVEARQAELRGSASFLIDPDTVPPEVEDVFAGETSVSLRLGPAAVPVTAEFRDVGSGVRSAIGVFDGPLGAGITGLVTFTRISEEPVGDSVVSSVFEGFLEIPANVGAGTWTLSGLRADDRSSNSSRWGADDLDALGLTVRIVASTSIGG